MENKNTFIAVALMLLVWVAFTIMFPTPQAPAPVSTPATVATSTPAVVPAAQFAQPPLPTAGASTAGVTVTAPLRELTVETELYRAVLTTDGARLKSLQLKKYQQSAAAAAQNVDLVTVAQDNGTLVLSGEGDFQLPADSRFFCQEQRSTLQAQGTDSLSLSFTLPLANGTVLTRTYTFVGNSYRLDLAVQIHNPTPSLRQGRLALVQREDVNHIVSGQASDFAGTVTLSGDKLHNDKVDALKKEEHEYRDALLWSAFKSKYFITALVPGERSIERVNIRRQGDVIEQRFWTAPLELKSGESRELHFTGYFGPVAMEQLKAFGHQLERAVDLGWFAIVGRPLFYVLKFFNNLVHNYGWAIIILTILIKLAFWPLTNKSYASMKAMQKLHPEIKKLQEKYKNDRERMNREVMEMYSKHRVNPMMGCLPMLVQIPIFIALYNVLQNMIELRHAPFLLWITDLSAKDPYYVTPLVMGATMFIQQKLTPSQMDPIQQKVMLFLPVIFTFMFLNFPSGLVIYWLVNNLLSIFQQVLINRRPD